MLKLPRIQQETHVLVCLALENSLQTFLGYPTVHKETVLNWNFKKMH